jgi:predicted nucleotidyltransferase
MLENHKLKELINKFKEQLQNLYQERLYKIILYGSYSRGTATQNSDIDFLVVLKDEKISLNKEIDNITDAIFQLLLVCKIDISFLPMSKQKFETEKSPLLFYVRKEGIEI